MEPVKPYTEKNTNTGVIVSGAHYRADWMKTMRRRFLNLPLSDGRMSCSMGTPKLWPNRIFPSPRGLSTKSRGRGLSPWIGVTVSWIHSCKRILARSNHSE